MGTTQERALEIVRRTKAEASKLPPAPARERRERGRKELERLLDSGRPRLVAAPRIEFPSPPGSVAWRRFHDARSRR